VLTHRLLLTLFFWLLVLIQGFIYTSNTTEVAILQIFLLNIFYAIPVIIDSQILAKAYFAKKKYKRYFVCLVLLIFLNSIIAVYMLKELVSINIVTFQHIFNTIGFLIMSGLIRMYQNNMLQQVKYQEMQSIQAQYELSLLKSQIHPHFLFNTLNSIYSLALDRSEKAAEVVLRLSDLIRYILHQSEEGYVSVSHEIDYLQNYLWLEKLRLGSRADIKFEIKGDTTKMIRPLLFLPFVENSFKHGVDEQRGNVFVHITIMIEDKGLIFDIKNNKPIEENSKSSFKSGLGLPNIKRRLAILYPEKHSLKQDIKPDYYKVTLHLSW